MKTQIRIVIGPPLISPMGALVGRRPPCRIAQRVVMVYTNGSAQRVLGLRGETFVALCGDRRRLWTEAGCRCPSSALSRYRVVVVALEKLIKAKLQGQVPLERDVAAVVVVVVQKEGSVCPLACVLFESKKPPVAQGWACFLSRVKGYPLEGLALRTSGPTSGPRGHHRKT